MQSMSNEPESDAGVWEHIVPMLDDAMGRLSRTDRDAIVLRFFENKTASEVAKSLKSTEAAAHKRVSRALEKLRKSFSKRRVALSAAVIAGAVSANSVQAAPVGLAATVAATTIKGSALTASTSAVVKGALELMVWAKAKTAIVVGASALLIVGTTTVAIEKAVTSMNSVLTQQLSGGSTLTLNRMSFGNQHEFGRRGPTNAWSSGQKTLVVEFRLSGMLAADNAFAKPAFGRQFRCVLHGEQGIDFVQEFVPNKFTEYSGDYYGYIVTRTFPRDSRWLWFRIEESETNNPYGPWQTVAEFKTKNPARPANHSWTAIPTPTTNTVGAMSFVLGEVTVELRPPTQHDIWNHVVTVPTSVYDGTGNLLTNWSLAYVKVEDASGNWSGVVQGHRSLDPRYVWKLEMDFGPVSGFAEESLATVDLPNAGRYPVIADVMGVPVSVPWNGEWVEASIPTNRTDLALKFVCATDAQGRKAFDADTIGSWRQHHIRKGGFGFRLSDRNFTMASEPVSATIAVVPNVRTTFYAQPRLVTDEGVN